MNRGFAPIVVLFVVGILVAGGYIIFSKGSFKPQNVAQIIKSPNPTPLTDCILGIQFARNNSTDECKKFSNSCDIPKDWTLIEGFSDKCYSTETAPIQETANWQTFTIKTVGLKFDLPSHFAKGTTLKEEILGSEVTGSILCVRISKTTTSFIKDVFAGYGGNCFWASQDLMLIGGASAPYVVPSETGFEAAPSVNFYINLPDSQEVINPNGVRIIKVKGKPSESGLNFDPSENETGVIIFTHHSIHKHLAFRVNNLTINPETLDQILSTFKFVE